MQERLISSLAQQAIGSLAQRVEATYRVGDETAQVTATVAGLVPRTPADISAAQERVKIMCFRAQEALWTSANGIPLHEVTVTVLGPVIDDYGDKMTAAYGAAVLTAATAARFHWDSLSPDTAWEDYDNVYLAVRFAPNQIYGVTPSAHP